MPKLRDRELEAVAEELAGQVCRCPTTSPLGGHDPDRSVECAHTRTLVLATLEAMAARGVRPPEPPKPRVAEYRIVGSWLVEVVEECTCGTGGIVTAPHEAGCGTDPIVDLSKLRDWPSGPEPLIRAEAMDDLADRLVDTGMRGRWPFIEWIRAQAQLQRKEIPR